MPAKFTEMWGLSTKGGVEEVKLSVLNFEQLARIHTLVGEAEEAEAALRAVRRARNAARIELGNALGQ